MRGGVRSRQLSRTSGVGRVSLRSSAGRRGPPPSNRQSSEPSGAAYHWGGLCARARRGPASASQAHFHRTAGTSTHAGGVRTWSEALGADLKDHLEVGDALVRCHARHAFPQNDAEGILRVLCVRERERVATPRQRPPPVRSHSDTRTADGTGECASEDRHVPHRTFPCIFRL